MGFFGLFGNKDKSENKPERSATEVTFSPFATVEGRVISAFTRVKQDITLLSSWLKYLRHKDMLNDQHHTRTQRELGEHKIHIAQLKAEAAEFKTAVKELQEELKAGLAEAKTGSFPNLIRTKSEPKADLKRTYFENRVVSTLRSRKRDYVLKQIFELAAKETHSTSEIEEVIVGEKALCGRTAFYDYMRELKHKHAIRRSEKGSKKVVVAEKAGLEQVR